MTEAAQAFVTPLTFQALSGHPVGTELLDTTAEAEIGHIELADAVDGIIVAPATANLCPAWRRARRRPAVSGGSCK